MRTILNLEIDKVSERLEEREITLHCEESAEKFLVEKGSDAKFGARPMRRAVENYVEDLLAEKILRGDINDGDVVTVSHEEEADKLTFTAEATSDGEKEEEVIETT